MFLTITGGRFRGRKIKVSHSRNLRPTRHLVREALFDILQARVTLTGCRFLDWCAGSGAVGIEAFSRGAAFVEFVEKDRKLRAGIRRNLKGLGIEEDFRLSAVFPHGRDFDLLFADPPYAEEALARRILDVAGALVKPGGWIVIETEGTFSDFGEDPREWSRYRYGETVLHCCQVPSRDPGE
ncbi:MAG: 16S rRNA (guanine(966)-N(2))-methyltransferase RsmD [Candidatus Hydrogenedentota bacterium]|nr:MAG: 16S rRNA (guanine(966)-N(2))-methyltransferase RsmD [Candidatus Hydrogenedentota bacterium]